MCFFLLRIYFKSARIQLVYFRKRFFYGNGFIHSFPIIGCVCIPSERIPGFLSDCVFHLLSVSQRICLLFLRHSGGCQRQQLCSGMGYYSKRILPLENSRRSSRVFNVKGFLINSRRCVLSSGKSFYFYCIEGFHFNSIFVSTLQGHLSMMLAKNNKHQKHNKKRNTSLRRPNAIRRSMIIMKLVIFSNKRIKDQYPRCNDDGKGDLKMFIIICCSRVIENGVKRGRGCLRDRERVSESGRDNILVKKSGRKLITVSSPDNGRILTTVDALYR